MTENTISPVKSKWLNPTSLVAADPAADRRWAV